MPSYTGPTAVLSVQGDPPLLELLLELRQRLEEVGDQAVVGHLEDGRVLVLVDGDDDLGVLHACQVLDRSRQPHRNVQVRRHDLAGLPDLHVVGAHARVDRRARRAHRGVERARERVKHREVLGRAHAAPARDDGLGGGELGPVRLGDLLGDPRCSPLRRLRRDRRDLRRASARRRLVEDGRAHGHHLDGVRRLDDGERVARVDRPHEGGLVLHLEHVRDLRHVEQRRHARQQPLAKGGRARHDVRVAAGLLERQDDGRPRFGDAVVHRRILQHRHLVDARHRRSGICSRLAGAAANQDGGGAKRGARGHGGERRLRQLGAIVLADDQGREPPNSARREPGHPRNAEHGDQERWSDSMCP
eukprot:scaffold114566_cov63-Phaeocystis_antarctica.AAC.2